MGDRKRALSRSLLVVCGARQTDPAIALAIGCNQSLLMWCGPAGSRSERRQARSRAQVHRVAGATRPTEFA